MMNKIRSCTLVGLASCLSIPWCIQIGWAPRWGVPQRLVNIVIWVVRRMAGELERGGVSQDSLMLPLIPCLCQNTMREFT